MLFSLYGLVVGGGDQTKAHPDRWRSIPHLSPISKKSNLKWELWEEMTLAPLFNPTDLKCDVWENAMATRSPEVLSICLIRGETIHLTWDRDVLWAPGRSLRCWSETSFPILNLATEGFQWVSGIRDCVKISRKGGVMGMDVGLF